MQQKRPDQSASINLTPAGACSRRRLFVLAALAPLAGTLITSILPFANRFGPTALKPGFVIVDGWVLKESDLSDSTTDDY